MAESAPSIQHGRVAEIAGSRTHAEPWQGGAAPSIDVSQAYAAIDLGTNNCRLLIARPAGAHFTVVDAFSRAVRLGEGLVETGRLGDAAMDRAVAALAVCADKLRRRNVRLARSVATEACRRAGNGAAFIARVHAETGIRLDVISAREEARLAVLGCHVLLEPGFGPALVFDIGGGSTELVLIESGPTVPAILDWVSVPWGVVSLTEGSAGEGADLAARATRYAAMRAAVSESLGAFAARIAPFARAARAAGEMRLLGTSGTVTTLASLHLGLAQYDRGVVDGLIVRAAPSGRRCHASAGNAPSWSWRVARSSTRFSTSGRRIGWASPTGASARASCAASSAPAMPASGPGPGCAKGGVERCHGGLGWGQGRRADG